MSILQRLPSLQENILLANHTTFRIGGPAKYFYIAKNNNEIVRAVQAAKEESIPFYILGGGSNLLVSDEGFGGLIIKIQNSKFKIEQVPREREQSDNAKLKITAEAGAPLIRIILESTKQGYSGLEWGFGIPGTIGGAIYGNAHRLGQAIEQIVEGVEILDSSFTVKILKNDECEFAYGESRFKKTGEIILSATLLFKKQEQKIIDDVLERAKKVVRQHPPFPSAGCVFRNYEIQGDDDILLNAHPELASWVRDGKIGVGYLIDQCGLKGKQIGQAKIPDEHANFIVNLGGARAEDVVALVNLCKEKVKEKFGIELEEEIRYLGF